MEEAEREGVDSERVRSGGARKAPDERGSNLRVLAVHRKDTSEDVHEAAEQRGFCRKRCETLVHDALESIVHHEKEEVLLVARMQEDGSGCDSGTLGDRLRRR